MFKKIKILSLFSLLVFGAFSISAQENRQTKTDEAILIDEFGELNPERLTQKMEFLRSSLGDNSNAKGYVIIYRGKELPYGYPIRFRVQLQNYLIKYLGVPQERFTILNGGLSDKRKTQLWIVPAGSKPPLTDSVETIELDKTVLFDEFAYPTPYDDAGCCAIAGHTEEAKQASLDNLARHLKEKPDAKAHLIAYGQFCTDCSSTAYYSRSGKYLGLKPDIYLDSSKTIAAILRKEKNYLIKRHNIDARRILTTNGGYRKWQEIELWLVPDNGENPKPNPTAFPPKHSKTPKTEARR